MSEVNSIDNGVYTSENIAYLGQRKTVEVNGIPWQYLEHGNPDGIPILSIHGWLGSSAEGGELLGQSLAGHIPDSMGMQTLEKNSPEGAKALQEKIESLKGKYRVITPELPGFGYTPPLPGTTNLTKLADSLVHFTNELQMDKPIVFGGSMGGIIAVKMAARYPDRVNSIVLQGTMTRPKDMELFAFAGTRLFTLPPVVSLVQKLNISRPLFKLMVGTSKDFKMANPETQKRVIEAADKADEGVLASTLYEVGLDIKRDIEKVTCPVLIIDGANGDLVPIARSEYNAAHRFHPDKSRQEKSPSHVVFLPMSGQAGEHGHNLMNTCPEAVAAGIDYVESYWNPSQVTQTT